MQTSGGIIFRYFKKHWFRYLSGILIVILSTFLGTLIPRFLGLAIDGLSTAEVDLSYVKRIAWILAAIGLAAFITRFIWRYLILGFCRHIEFFLRKQLFAHLQTLSSDFYTKFNTGDIITRAIVDVQAVRMMMGFAATVIIEAIITTVMSVVNMSMSTNFFLTILAVSPVPFLILLIVRVRLVVRKRYINVQKSISDISSKVQENITGIRVMKAFSQESREEEVFSELSQNKVEAEIKLAKSFALISPAVQLTFGIVFSIFLMVGGGLVSRGIISLGDYVSFNAYLLLIIQPISHVGRVVDRWQRGSASMKRLDELFLARPTVDDSKADKSIKELQSGNVLMKNLSFSYDSQHQVLQEVSFKVPSGGSIAIMGETGSGKSTIAQLMTRVWNLESDNMLLIDDKNINSIPLKTLRTHIAYVPQESFLFSDSIMENIRFYDGDITDEQVIEAAKAAYVHENIIAFPKGYQTVVGERGMTLSGGQKQRIALARALVRSPKILILDDCMSAVDAETEQMIVQNLKTLITNCTAVIITHRLSAAKLADTILLLDKEGRVADFGDHESLMQKGGAYTRLVELIQQEEENMGKGGKQNDR